MLKAIGEMIDNKIGVLDSRFDKIEKELNEFRKETSENFNNLSDKMNNLEGTNADNHIAIKEDIKNLKETVEEIEVDLKMVKKITVVNSEDI